MNFDFSPEQTQIADSLRRYLNDRYDMESRSKRIASGAACDEAVWRELAELGVLAISLPERCDGFGGSAFDSLLVMQELGRALVVEPYVSAIVVASKLVEFAGSEQQQQDILANVASGSCIPVLAHTEPGSRYNLNYVTCTARQSADGWVLDGVKSTVLAGAAADLLLVSARVQGSIDDTGGVSLFIVNPREEGVSISDYLQRDGTRAADIGLSGVQVAESALLGAAGDALPVIFAAIDHGIAGLCAEAVGIMDVMVESTTEYLKTRKQFGMPLAAFQALQHRLADMLLHLEQARSMSLLVASKMDASASERSHVASAAKTLVGDAARFVGQQAVQLHGGIGVTDEMAISHYFRRLMTINASFGDRHHHLESYAKQMASVQLSSV